MQTWVSLSVLLYPLHYPLTDMICEKETCVICKRLLTCSGPGIECEKIFPFSSVLLALLFSPSFRCIGYTCCTYGHGISRWCSIFNGYNTQKRQMVQNSCSKCWYSLEFPPKPRPFATLIKQSLYSL